MGHRSGSVILLVVGIVVLITGATTSTLLIDQLESFAAGFFDDGAPNWFLWTFTALTFLAGLGGLGLIAASILGFLNLTGAGRMVAWIATLGIFTGVVLQAIVLISEGEGEAGFWTDAALLVGLVGGIVATWARKRMS